MTCFTRLTTLCLIFSTAALAVPAPAKAGVVSTHEVIESGAAGAAQAPRERVQSFMQREEVRTALQARGVDPRQASARVQALSDDEVAQLAGQIDRLPAAGTDVLGFALVIFVLLLFTDILGLTKVFPFTRSVR